MIREIDLDLLHASREVDSMLSALSDGKQVFCKVTVKALKKFGDAVGAQTLTEAWHIFQACDAIRAHLKNLHSERAEVAYWYGLNPFELSDSQVLALKGSTEKMLCQERIQRGKYDPLDYEGIYRMFLLAYGDENLARKRQSESFRLYVEKVTKNK